MQLISSISRLWNGNNNTLITPPPTYQNERFALLRKNRMKKKRILDKGDFLITPILMVICHLMMSLTHLS